MALVLIDEARYSALRLEISTIHQTAGYSVLSQYHRQLWGRYGLLFFNTDDFNEDILKYMNDNFEKDSIGSLLGTRDLLAITAEENQQEWISLATDSKGIVLRRQCVECMKEKYGITYLEQLEEWMRSITEAGLLEEEIKLQIDGKEWGEEEIRWEIENNLQDTMLPSSFHYLEQEALKFLLGEKTFSEQKMAHQSRLSERTLLQGNGLCEGLELASDLWDQLLFVEYVLNYTGNYVTPLEDGYMKYQTEYILSGEEVDGENLWNVANKLLKLRTCANTIGILADEGRNTFVGELSSSMATALGNPEIEPVIYAAIILLWAEIEGIYDVKNLLKGDSVDLLKTNEDWLIDVSVIEGLATITEDKLEPDEGNKESYFALEELGVMNASMAEPQKETAGGQKHEERGCKEEMFYEDYLRIFLWFQDGEITTLRLMDIIESDIREITKQPAFCLDLFADFFRVKTKVTSTYGKEFWITREYGY